MDFSYYYIEDAGLYEIPYAGLSKTVCHGSSVTIGSGTLLPAALGATYQWFEAGNPNALNPNTAAFAYTFTPAQTATYTLTVTIPAGQGFAGSVTTSTVTVNVSPAVTANASFSVCGNAPRQLLTGNPAGGSWSGLGLSIIQGQAYFDPSLVPVTATAASYVLTYSYTHAATNCSNTATVTVTVNPVPQATVTTQPAGLCSDGSATVTIFNGQAGHTYTVCLNGAPCYSVAGQQGSFSFPLNATQPGNYTVTVTDTQFPACPTTLSFSINLTGAQLLGAYGQLTTIDASQPPYSGTVTFSGQYRVQGPLEFINGDFHLVPGTLFAFMPDGGVAPNSLVPQPVPAYTTYPQGGARNYQPSILKVGAGATLHLDAATLTACNATEKWGGVHLANGGSITTQSGVVNGVSTQSVISQACAGVAASQPAANTLPANAYDINGTHFTGNDVGFWETYRPHAGGTVSGIRHSAFTGNNTGIWLVSHNKPAFTPDYGAVALDSNSFVNNVTGFYNGNGYTMNGVVLRGNTFSGNTAFAVRGCGNLLNNTVTVPAGAVGFYASSQLVQGNAVTAAISGNGTGLKIDYCPWPSVVTGNTLSGLVTGVDLTAQTEVQLEGNTLQNNNVAVLLAPYSLQTISGNTFTGNQTGIEVAAGSAYGLTPPDIRCNTFTAPNVTNSRGIYLEPGARVTAAGNQNRLANQGKPSGNKFDGTVTEPVRNDGTDPLTYWVYNSSLEENVNQVHGTTGGTAALGDPGELAVNACDPGPGIQARVAGRTTQASERENPAYLGRSYPNPTQGQATVSYKLPSGTVEAAILLRDVMTGKVVRTFKLPATAPESSLEMRLEGLKNGIYAYTLTANGKTIASKLLVISR